MWYVEKYMRNMWYVKKYMRKYVVYREIYEEICGM